MQKTMTTQDYGQTFTPFSHAMNALNFNSLQMSSRLEDVLAMQHLPELKGNVYIPWTDSAIRPAALTLLLNEISIHRRRFIVECGTGISTLYIAKIIEQSDARLVSIDHDSRWQEVVKAQLNQADITLDKVQFISTPLVACALSPKGNHWYDTNVIERELPYGAIDLLLVDAPIAAYPSVEESRYPALPFFMNRLAQNFAVFLDDCHRRGEQAIAKAWVEKYKLHGRFFPDKGNICMFHPPNAKRYNIV